MLASLFRLIDPRTWPWPIWIWLAFVLFQFSRPMRRRFQRERAAFWPVADGRIESANVSKQEGAFHSGSTPYSAELGYSYSVEGSIYGDVYKREFATAEEGWAFVRDLQGKPVVVHYHPVRHRESLLDEESVNVLLEARAPLLAGERAYEQPDAVPIWSKPFCRIGALIAAVGLVLSLWVHIGAVLGRRVAPAPLFFALHLGAILLWFPTIFVLRSMEGSLTRKDLWKRVLCHAPDWMRTMVYVFFGYAILNFALFMAKAPPGNKGSGGDPPAEVWRGFSGHWMAFYSAIIAVLYSAGSRRLPGEETKL